MLVIQGTAASRSNIQVFFNGTLLGTTGTDDQGNWTYVYSTSGGVSSTGQVTAVASDTAGNTASSAVFNLNLGSAAPAITSLGVQGLSSIAGWLSYASTSNNTPTLVGTATAGSVVNILDGNTVIGTTTADAQGNWSFTTSSLTGGFHLIRVDATLNGSTSVLSGPLVLNITS
jgi:hypothetical protein